MSKKLINFSTPYILNGEFFEIISQEGESVTVRCCHCDTRNIYKGSVKSTGNFHMHIKRKHPALLPKVHELKLSSFLNRKLLPRAKFSGKYKTNDIKIGPVTNSSHKDVIETETKENNNLENNSTIIRIDDVPIKTEDNSNNDDSQSMAPQPPIQAEPCLQPTNQPELNNEANRITRPQFEQVISRIENYLKSVDREMHLRNEIESNRLVFEWAKFKYLHPEFNFRL